MNALPDQLVVERELIRLHPAGRIGTPRDVSNAVVWLASDGADFVTGPADNNGWGANCKGFAPAIMDIRT